MQVALEVSVRRAVVILWTIGLVGALVMTLVIVKEVMLVVRALRDIDNLGQITLKAAGGVAGNTSAVAKLDGLGGPVGEISAATQKLGQATAKLEQAARTLTRQPARRGG